MHDLGHCFEEQRPMLAFLLELWTNYQLFREKRRNAPSRWYFFTSLITSKARKIMIRHRDVYLIVLRTFKGPFFL